MTGRSTFPAEPLQLRAFCSRNAEASGYLARGNPCLITLLSSQPSAPLQSPVGQESTQCLTWPLDEKSASVACWTSGETPIKICGHGLLCCAALWMDIWGDRGTLIMNDVKVACRADGGKVWLGFEPLAPHACAVPHWCKRYFPSQPSAAAIAGPGDAYLILQWPKGFPLRSLPAPGASLGEDTQRALIVTCAADRDSLLAGEDIHYRYFAPQHGVNEDAATGSAMRVLASFWQQRDLGHALTAYQQSEAGGLLFSRIQADSIWVGGWAVAVPQETETID